MQTRHCSRQGLGIVACIAAVVLTVAACGSSGSGVSASSGDAANCSGSPVEVMVIASLTGQGQHQDDMPATAKAAAKAINAGCELGRPLDIKVCDDQTTPNSAAACARRAVADKVLAVVDDGLLGESITPILQAGHVVDISALQVGQAQMSSPWVFAFGPAMMGLLGQANTVVSAGATKINIITLNIPAVVDSWKQTVPLIKALGAPAPSFTLIPPTAIDMTTYVAQALATGATGIIAAVGGQQLEGVLKGLSQQGVSLTKVKVTAGTGSFDKSFESFMTKNPAMVDGLLVVSWDRTSRDLSNRGIATMMSELREAGEQTTGISSFGIATWTAVHTIAKLMHGDSTMDSPALKRKLDKATVTEPQLAPLDFTKPAFKGDPVLGDNLGSRRIPTSSFALHEICDGTLVPVTKDFVSVLEKVDVGKTPC